jgi:glycosyltransferase involved in cell wall biosynthesis
MRICLLEPYNTGSHRAWAEGYAAASSHDVRLLTLSGQFWKWRMHGGAVTLARIYREQLASAGRPDLLLATDMLDLGSFLALTRHLAHDLPVALYMHENQLTYPPRPGEKRDLHYGFTNYTSMLCADRILFNSQYHLESWFDELPRLLKHFPDYNELPTVPALRARSEVLPLGLDLARLEALRPEDAAQNTGAAEVHKGASPAPGDPPLILWNHRWEYDKNPGEFLEALHALAAEGWPFRLVLLGEMFVRTPPEFAEARERLGARILQFGYVPSYAGYAAWLWRADIVVSTAHHDFFGAAVVEAMICGCWPVLPDRLSYPQFIPAPYREACLYSDFAGLLALLRQALAAAPARRDVAHAARERTPLRQAAAQYDWRLLAPEYDRRLAALITS